MNNFKTNIMLENKLNWYSAVAANVFLSSNLMANPINNNLDPDLSEAGKVISDVV